MLASKYVVTSGLCAALALTGCSNMSNDEMLGTGGGAVVGGLAGSLVGHGTGRLVAIGAGAAIGAVAGEHIAKGAEQPNNPPRRDGYRYYQNSYHRDGGDRRDGYGYRGGYYYQGRRPYYTYPYYSYEVRDSYLCRIDRVVGNHIQTGPTFRVFSYAKAEAISSRPNAYCWGE